MRMVRSQKCRIPAMMAVSLKLYRIQLPYSCHGPPLASWAHPVCVVLPWVQPAEGHADGFDASSWPVSAVPLHSRSSLRIANLPIKGNNPYIVG